jgi:hypothetical protein
MFFYNNDRYILLFFLIFFNFLSNAQQKPLLSSYKYDHYSQNGEDGIIEKIFKIIQPESKLCIEFGAWDGFHLSNTAHLWTKDDQWKAILIEGDKQKYQELKIGTNTYNVIALNSYIGTEKEVHLEKILEKNGISPNTAIDIISIDIDGNDYHIFDSLKKLNPRLIICEYNPTIPYWIDVYQKYNPDSYWEFGCSLGSLNRLAQEKGYQLIATTFVNAFFVKEEEFDKFKDFETDIHFLADTSCYSSIVTSYSGEYVLLNGEKEHLYGLTKPYKKPLLGKYNIDSKNITIS